MSPDTTVTVASTESEKVIFSCRRKLSYSADRTLRYHDTPKGTDSKKVCTSSGFHQTADSLVSSAPHVVFTIQQGQRVPALRRDAVDCSNAKRLDVVAILRTQHREAQASVYRLIPGRNLFAIPRMRSDLLRQTVRAELALLPTLPGRPRASPRHVRAIGQGPYLSR